MSRKASFYGIEVNLYRGHTFMTYISKVVGWVQKICFKMRMGAVVKKWIKRSDSMLISETFFSRSFPNQYNKNLHLFLSLGLQQNLLLIWVNLTLILALCWVFFFVKINLNNLEVDNFLTGSYAHYAQRLMITIIITRYSCHICNTRFL